MVDIQPLYGCVVSRPKPKRIGFWTRIYYTLFGGFIRRWNAFGGKGNGRA